MRISLAFLLLVMVGVLGCKPESPSSTGFFEYSQEEIDYHWGVVQKQKAYWDDPDSYEYEPALGMSSAGLPPDFPPIEPSLAVLVAADELAYVNVILPAVPKTPEAVAYWMKWTNERQDRIWYGVSPASRQYEISGPMLLSFEFWCEESLEQEVQELIDDLEAVAAGG